MHVPVIVSLYAVIFVSGISLASAATPKLQAEPEYVPQNLVAPSQSWDEKSVVLVWNKPEHYADVADYEVFMNGRLLGKARDNARQHSPAQPWIDRFYAEDTQKIHVTVQAHNFTVTGLRPRTQYRFAVRARYQDGSVSKFGDTIKVTTSAVPTVCDVTKNGAIGDGQTLNTLAIQKTIEACPANGKVLIPAGSFRSGAIFLKSNMTLEIAEGATLQGSDNPEDYPLARGYTLYSYSSTQRPPSLINAIDPEHRSPGSFRNIRIVGGGVIDGNGFMRATPDSIAGEGGMTLPQYIFTNNRTVGQGGILAKNQVEGAVKEGLQLGAAYSQRRSSLMTLRGVMGLYISGITLRNPAFHGLMVLEGLNVAVNGLKVTTWDVNNADGFEFGNSAHVLVFNNFLDTGDDCVNFAAGTGADAEKQEPMQDAWIFNNYMRRGHGAVVLGSHTGAWIQDILAEDNVVNLTWTGLRAKTNNINGGGGRSVLYRDNAHRDLQREAISFTTEYSDVNALLDYKPATASGRFGDILVQHNSVEFTANWQPTPVPQGPGGKLVIVDFSPVYIQGDAKNNVYHENITVDDLMLVGAYPVKIDGLKNGLLSRITFRNWRGAGNPWSVANAPGTRFKDIQLQPGELSKAASSAP